MSVPVSSPPSNVYPNLQSRMGTAHTSSPMSPPMENQIPAHGGIVPPMPTSAPPAGHTGQLNRPMSVPPPTSYGNIGVPASPVTSRPPPFDKPFDKPYDKPYDKPMDKSLYDKPYHDKPYEKMYDKPYDKLYDKPFDNPFPAHAGGGLAGGGLGPMSVMSPMSGGSLPGPGQMPSPSLASSMSAMSAAMSAMAASPLVVPQPLKMTRPNKTYHCRMCDQMFEQKSDLMIHSQHVHRQDPKPYRCPTCHKCFANSSYLSQHNRIHTGVKPYKCQVCERKFTQLCHLRQHMRTHTGEKPYKCQAPGCGKAFTQLSNLQSHSRSHMTDKPYRCNSCYKCFSDEQGLREHIPKHSETKHLKTQICHICGKSYTQETYLARHMQKHNFDASGRPGQLPPKPLSMQTGHNSMMGYGSMGMGMGDRNGMGPLFPGQTPQGWGTTGGMNDSSRSSSAFMPLAHQYGGGGSMNMSNMMNTGAMGSSFPFPPPRIPPGPPSTLNSPLPHISSVNSSRYFPFDPMGSFSSHSNKGMQRDGGTIPHSLLSLQQIKNFSANHGSVFPKSEPSSPTKEPTATGYM